MVWYCCSIYSERVSILWVPRWYVAQHYLSVRVFAVNVVLIGTLVAYPEVRLPVTVGRGWNQDESN